MTQSVSDGMRRRALHAPLDSNHVGMRHRQCASLLTRQMAVWFTSLRAVIKIEEFDGHCRTAANERTN